MVLVLILNIYTSFMLFVSRVDFFKNVYDITIGPIGKL
jgi:hypothetical protein